MMTKTFCKECKHLCWIGMPVLKYICDAPNNYEDNWKRIKGKRKQDPQEKNEANDCKDFQPKIDERPWWRNLYCAKAGRRESPASPRPNPPRPQRTKREIVFFSLPTVSEFKKACMAERYHGFSDEIIIAWIKAIIAESAK